MSIKILYCENVFNWNLNNIAHVCVRLFLCLQFVLPSMLSAALPYQHDFASYICSPSGQAVSVEAQAAISELLTLLNETDEDSDLSSQHCEKCTTSSLALPNPAEVHGDYRFCRQYIAFLPFNTGFVHKAQGPPSGSRAPPPSI